MGLFASEISKSTIPCVKTGTTIAEALSLMEEYKVSHLVIVNNEDLLGIVSEEDLLRVSNVEEAVGAISLTIQGCVIDENSNIFDVLWTVFQNKLSLVPIVDKNNKYKGTLLASTLLREISELLSVNNPGGVIILEMNVADYSLTQISNIVEANDSFIISSFVRTMPNTTLMHVVLKVNNSDIGNILQTFTRYNYKVLASYGKDMMDDVLKDRYELLMRYLNV